MTLVDFTPRHNDTGVKCKNNCTSKHKCLTFCEIIKIHIHSFHVLAFPLKID